MYLFFLSGAFNQSFHIISDAKTSFTCVHYGILRQFTKFLLSIYFQQIPTKTITLNHNMIMLLYSVSGLYTIFRLFYRLTIHSMPICFSSQHLLFPRHDPKNPSVYPAYRPIMPRFAPHDHILNLVSTPPTWGPPCPHLPYNISHTYLPCPHWAHPAHICPTSQHNTCLPFAPGANIVSNKYCYNTID